MEAEPGVELRVLSLSALCTYHVLRFLSSRQEQQIFLQEGQASTLIAANRGRNGGEGQAYLPLPFAR